MKKVFNEAYNDLEDVSSDVSPKIPTKYRISNNESQDTLKEVPEDAPEEEKAATKYLDENQERLQVIEGTLSYEFSSSSFYKFTTIAYIIQKVIDKHINMVISNERKFEYNYDYNKNKQIIKEGAIVFYYKEQIFYYIINYRSYMNKIVSNKSVNKLVDAIKFEIKNNNPLRNKHLHLYETSDGLSGTIKKKPNVKFSDVILNEDLKSDIYDNTIFHLDNIKENNGVILFGRPGVGKSLICSAIINEAIKKGYSTCYLCTKVDFSSLGEFLKDFLAPCILIYEDIDSLGQNRKEVLNTDLSSFLQFINGLTEGNDNIVYIATTNYLEHLDDAIKDRPMRFNRKFEFKYPNNEEVDQLIELYFNKNISDKYAKTCYNKQFTGAHIREIRRTATILSLKEKKKTEEVFEKSVKLVSSNFSTTLGDKTGF